MVVTDGCVVAHEPAICVVHEEMQSAVLHKATLCLVIDILKQWSERHRNQTLRKKIMGEIDADVWNAFLLTRCPQSEWSHRSSR